MQTRRIAFFCLSLYLFSVIILLIGCQAQQEKSEMTEQQMLEREKLLVTVGNCDACHTPKNFGPNGTELDMSRRFS